MLTTMLQKVANLILGIIITTNGTLFNSSITTEPQITNNTPSFLETKTEPATDLIFTDSDERNPQKVVVKELQTNNSPQINAFTKPGAPEQIELTPITPNQLTGFTSSSIAYNQSNINTTQVFTVTFDVTPTADILKDFEFYPKTDFNYTLNGNTATITPTHLDRSTTYVFGLIKSRICPMEISYECPPYFKYALKFTTSFRETIVYGKSVENRDLVAHIYGKNDASGTKVMITGGIHGNEWQAGGLWMLVEYFDQHPEEFLNKNKTLVIVPTINVDGAQINRKENSRGVNLNRNFPAYWEWASNRGPYALSEPESLSLYNFTLKEMPNFLISYHAQWPPYGIVFLGNNDSLRSMNFAVWVSSRTGYPIGIYENGAHVSGDQAEWAETVGITSVIIEATYAGNTDWNKNFPMYLALVRDLTKTTF